MGDWAIDGVRIRWWHIHDGMRQDLFLIPKMFFFCKCEWKFNLILGEFLIFQVDCSANGIMIRKTVLMFKINWTHFVATHPVNERIGNEETIDARTLLCNWNSVRLLLFSRRGAVKAGLNGAAGVDGAQEGGCPICAGWTRVNHVSFSKDKIHFLRFASRPAVEIAANNCGLVLCGWRNKVI